MVLAERVVPQEAQLVGDLWDEGDVVWSKLLFVVTLLIDCKLLLQLVCEVAVCRLNLLHVNAIP